jgi:hypothetical protein
MRMPERRVRRKMAEAGDRQWAWRVVVALVQPVLQEEQRLGVSVL